MNVVFAKIQNGESREKVDEMFSVEKCIITLLKYHLISLTETELDADFVHRLQHMPGWSTPLILNGSSY